MVIGPGNEIRRGVEMRKDFAKLFASKAFADVTFVVQGRKIQAHKAILAARSEYFNQMFSSESMESLTVEVPVEDADLLAFRIFLHLIYGDLDINNLNHTQILKILVLADKYRVDGLSRSCLEMIERGTDASNVALALTASGYLNSEKLREISFGILKEMSEKNLYFT